MELKGSRIVAADPGTVWRGIFDPEVLKACVPGCTEFTGCPVEGYQIAVVQKVGPVKAVFRGELQVSRIVEHRSVRLDAAGKGGLAELARGGADVRLLPDESGTQVGFAVEVSLRGKLAKLGAGVIDRFGQKMADGFFERFERALLGETPGADVGQMAEPPAPKKGWFRRRPGG